MYHSTASLLLTGHRFLPATRSRTTARLALAGYLLLAMAGHAFAQAAGDPSPATMLNNVCNFIVGGFGQSLAVLGIIAIGVSWMFGRASLALIAGVIGGIVIMFGASFLGQQLTKGGGGT